MREQPLNESEVLYFMHIPKTAGTTLKRVLAAQFPAENVCPYSVIHELLRAAPEELNRYQLIMGHHYYPIDQVIERKPIYITLVRNPVDWVVSYYSHIQREPAHHHHHLAKSKSLLEFLQQPAAQDVIENYQTRYVAASPDLGAAARKIRAAAPDDLKAASAVSAKMKPKIVKATMLDTATQRLDECAFVGIAEQVETAVLVLSHLFGWKPPEAVPALNVSHNRPEINETARELIKELMAVDLQLYKYARVRHEAAIRETIKDLLQTIDNINIEKQNLLIAHEAVVAEHHTALQVVNAQQQALSRLAEIENGWGWKLILRLNRLRSVIFPPDSFFERVYFAVRTVLLGKN